MGRQPTLGMLFGERILEVTAGLHLEKAPESLSEMERKTKRAMLEVGRFLVESWLGLLDQRYPEDDVKCSCGGHAKYQCRRDGVLNTVFGTVHYKRAYYLCSQCHRGRFPLDEQLGLRAGEMSAEMESLLGLTGAQMPFGKGSDLFERLTLVSASPQTMDKATEAMGEEAMRVEEEWRERSHDAEAILTEERAGKEGPRLYGALDAVKFHSREHRNEEDNGWRDLKVGVWFRSDARPPEKLEDQWSIKAYDLSYYCDIADAETFGDLVWATGFQRQALRARELIFLGDGADWIWNLVSTHYPQAVQIVDWFHAAEHLGDVAKAVIVGEMEQNAWLKETKSTLWAGDVDGVIAALEKLAAAGKGEEVARKAAAYFDKHRSRMDYAAFRAKGYHIGSGTVESGCKQMGIQRMKVPGATWTIEGARRTAKARAAVLSGQWDDLAARRTHLPRAA